MKKILFFLLVLILSSCGGSGNDETVKGLTNYNMGNFAMKIPSHWKVLEKDSPILPKVTNSTVELAATSEDLKFGFSNNILVLSQPIVKDISSTDFSITNNVGSTKEYVEYQKIDAQNMTFADGSESRIFIFEARYSTTTPKFQYLQVGQVCGKVGYLITIALSTDIKDTSQYQEVIKTFTCRTEAE